MGDNLQEGLNVDNSSENKESTFLERRNKQNNWEDAQFYWDDNMSESTSFAEVSKN